MRNPKSNGQLQANSEEKLQGKQIFFITSSAEFKKKKKFKCWESPFKIEILKHLIQKIFCEFKFFYN